MRALRNVAIVALLALGVTVLPGGGNVASGILAALGLLFLAVVALLAVRFWHESSLTRDAMTDRQRGLVYGGLGALALTIAGTDELLDTGPGTIVWVALLVGSAWLVFNTWREASSL